VTLAQTHKNIFINQHGMFQKKTITYTSKHVTKVAFNIPRERVNQVTNDSEMSGQTYKKKQM
jgi:hypothetical protein